LIVIPLLFKKPLQVFIELLLLGGVDLGFAERADGAAFEPGFNALSVEHVLDAAV